jgi:V8-like Glu-specific endopeptidase
MDFFEEVERLVRRGQVGPAVQRLTSAIQGMEETLGSEIVITSVILFRRAADLQLEEVKRTQDRRELARQRDELVAGVLSFIPIVKEEWGSHPLPAIAAVSPAMQPDAAGGAIPPDPREVLFAGSPLRKLAWLRKGVEVAKAVCKVWTPRSVGTGFVLPGGKLMTNNHVIPSAKVAAEAKAIFDFEDDFDGSPRRAVAVNLLPKTLVTNPDRKIDCTIVSLEGRPAELRGWGEIELEVGDEELEGSGVSIIQHPDGGFKQVAISGSVLVGGDDTGVLYVTSTMPGSSGAPVFNDQWRVVALHQGGGTWSYESQRYINNRGIRCSAIARDAILGAHVKPPAKSNTAAPR